MLEGTDHSVDSPLNLGGGGSKLCPPPPSSERRPKSITKNVCSLGRFYPFLLATKAVKESSGMALFFFWTWSLEWGKVSASRAGRFLPPEKTRYPLYRRLGGPQGRYGQVRKNLAFTGIRSPDRPACNQSLYRLSYPAHKCIYFTTV
jgi:hypothetical protein